MDELAHFSIETDSVVLLRYKDGTERRVKLTELERYVTNPDLTKVRKAVTLRRNFLRTHMPKMSIFVLVLAGLVTFGLSQAEELTRLRGGKAALSPAPRAPRIEQRQALAPAATPTPTPTPTPAPVLGAQASAVAPTPMASPVTSPLPTPTPATGLLHTVTDAVAQLLR